MSKKNYYEQTDAQFKIRLPHELKDKIRASADEHNRTMTADIVARLEQSFTHEKSEVHCTDITNALADIMREIQSLKGATP